MEYAHGRRAHAVLHDANRARHRRGLARPGDANRARHRRGIDRPGDANRARHVARPGDANRARHRRGVRHISVEHAELSEAASARSGYRRHVHVYVLAASVGIVTHCTVGFARQQALNAYRKKRRRRTKISSGTTRPAEPEDTECRRTDTTTET